MTIAVTGGNGEFGSAVLDHLTDRTQQALVATVRDTTKGRRHAAVDYRPGNFDDPTTLRRSLTGVDTVLINATFFGADPSRRLARATAAIDAATQAGAARIVLTSWPDLENAAMPSVQNYRELEAAVKTAGPNWTIIRLNIGLADALARDIVWARKTGELVAPADGALATPAAITDLAAATATVLADGGHEGDTLELTGPDQLGWDDLAALAGTPFRAVTDEQYTAYLAESFALPDDLAELLTSMYADFRSPWASTPTTTAASLLSHPMLPGTQAVLKRAALFPTS